MTDRAEVASRLLDLYCMNMSKFSFMFVNREGEAQYLAEKERPLTIREVYAHLAGRKTISVFGADKVTCFCTFDLDESDPAKLRALVGRLVEIGIPRERLYISTSGNKGYHVDFFLDKPVYKTHGESLYKYLRREPEFAAMKLEYFPVKNRCIKIPLGINFKSGRRCWYLDPETLAPIEDERYVLGIEKWSADAFGELVWRLNKEMKLADIAEAKEHAGEWEEAEPARRVVMPKMADKEPVLTRTGERHNLMRSKAVFLRCCYGLDEDTIYAELMAWVGRQNQSLIESSEAEVERDARELAKDVVAKFVPSNVWWKQRLTESSKRGKITAADIGNILRAKKKSARKVAFLICVYCACFKTCTIGYRTMAEKLGLSYMTVSDAVHELIEQKIIRLAKRGGCVTVNGEPRFRANEYAFVAAASPDDRCVEFNFEEEKENIDGFYYRAMAAMVEPDELRRVMSKSEAARCDEVCPSDSANSQGKTGCRSRMDK